MYTFPDSTFSQAVATALAEHGMGSQNSTLREAAITVVPGIVQQVEVAGVDSRALVMAMVERLNDPEENVVQAAVKALLGVRGLLGDSARKYIDSLRLGQFRSANANPVQPARAESRRPKEEEAMQFGVVPTDIVKALRIDDWKVRSTAIEKLLVVIRGVEDARPIVPHLKGLLRLLGPLLDDPNFKIALTSIQITGELVDRAGDAVGAHADAVMPLLVEKFGDKKIVIRQGTMKVIVKLMHHMSAGGVINKLLPFSSHKNPHVREELLNVFMHAILEQGCDSIDLTAVVRAFRNGLFDAKDKVKYGHGPLLHPSLVQRPSCTPHSCPCLQVRFVAMEAFALLRAKLGEVAVEQFLAGIGDDVVRPLQMRFKDKSLPVIGESGLVEHNMRDSMNSAATSDDFLGQRPRHQSAGPHQGKIPWKMPTLKSRVGPSQSGRRNRSAAAVIISNNYKSPSASSVDGRAITTGAASLDYGSDAEIQSPAMQSPISHGVDNDFDMDGIHAPHVSLDWKRHADTESQVEAALRGHGDLVTPLYGHEEGHGYSPSFGSKKTPRPSSRHSPINRMFGQPLDTDTWQSVSPTTPGSCIFPGNPTYQGRSISPGLSISSGSAFGHHDTDSGYASSRSKSSLKQDKTSLWLPGAGTNSTGSPGRATPQSQYSSQYSPGHSGPSEYEMAYASSSPQTVQRKALATLKTKRKVPTAAATFPLEMSAQDGRHGGDVMNTHDIGRDCELGVGLGEGSRGKVVSKAALPPKPSLSHVSTKRREMQRQKHKAEMSRGEAPLTPEEGGGDRMDDLIMGKKVGQAESDKSDRESEQSPAGPSVTSYPLARQDLEPIKDLGRAMKAAFEGIRGDKWDKQLEATTIIRRIVMYQPEALRAQVGSLVKDLFGKDGPVMSLRSNLSRNALTCVADLMEMMGKDFDPHLEEIVKVLLNKQSEASGFINAEAEKAMVSLVDHTTESKVISSP